MVGDHFILRDRLDTLLVYEPTLYKPDDNLNYALTIQPLPCSYVSDYDLTDYCTDEVVTIYNKNRELFSIDVPVSLTISDIKIDSLDSVLFSVDPDVWSDVSCLREREQCCEITEGIVTSVDGSSVCEDALAEYLLSSEAECNTNVARALFKM